LNNGRIAIAALGACAALLCFGPVTSAKAQDVPAPFDASRLEELIRAANASAAKLSEPALPTAIPPTSAAVEAPVSNSPPDAPPVSVFNGCAMKLEEIEAEAQAIADELVKLEKNFAPLRPKFRSILAMLQAPASDEYCNAQWLRQIDDFKKEIDDLPTAVLKERAEKLLNCAIDKNPELQALKKRAADKGDNNSLQKLGVAENRLVAVDLSAGTLDTMAGELHKEHGRFQAGHRNAAELCDPIDF